MDYRLFGHRLLVLFVVGGLISVTAACSDPPEENGGNHETDDAGVSDTNGNGTDANGNGTDANGNGTDDDIDIEGAAYVAFTEEFCKFEGQDVEWCFDAESLDHDLWYQTVDLDGGISYVGADGIEPESTLTEVDSGAVCRVDQDGEQDWCVEFADGVDDLVVDVEGDIFVPVGASVTDFSESQLCKLDDTGDELWCRDLDFRPRTVVTTADDDGVYVGGYLDTLCRFDGDGNESWCDSDMTGSPQTMTMTDDGELFVGYGGGVSGYEVCRVDDQANSSGCFGAEDRESIIELEADEAGDLVLGLHEYESNPCKVEEGGAPIWCIEDEPGGEKTVRGMAIDEVGNITVGLGFYGVVQYDEEGNQIGSLEWGDTAWGLAVE